MDLEQKLMQIPILNWFLKILKTIKLPGFEGLSLYNLFKMYIIGIVRGALTSRASSIAFSLFLALFPFALFVLTIIPIIPIEGFQADFILLIKQGLPPKTSDAVDAVLFDIANNKQLGLMSFGFLLSMFLMTNGINALFSAFEYTYHTIKTRSVIRQYIVALSVSLLLVFSLISIVTFLISISYGVNEMYLNGWIENVSLWKDSVQIITLLITLFMGVAILYYFGTKDGKKIGFFSPGVVMTSLLILANFKLFSIYISKFSQYNELYGSIGSLIVLMLFIWLNAIILLLGYELNTSLICLKNESNDLQNK